MAAPVLVLITCGSEEEARTIARNLVDARLAAGVQILPIESVYTWESEVVEDDEWLLICKTGSHRYERIEAMVGELHSYEVVPIYMIEMTSAGDPYRRWIEDATAKPS